MEYIKLKDYPFKALIFTWVVCIKTHTQGKVIFLGYKWEVLNGINCFFKREELLNSNVLRCETDTIKDLVTITTDFEL